MRCRSQGLRATRKHLEDSVVLQSSPVPKAPEQTARVDAAAPIAPSRLVGALGDKRLLSVASVLVVLAIWQWGAGHVSGFLLPAPADVLARFLDPQWLSRLLNAFAQSLV